MHPIGHRDLNVALNTHRLSAFQVLVVVLCTLTLMLDGFDTMAIGFVAPAIVKGWHISRADITPAFALGQIGIMLGAIFFGPLADRIGRRPVVIGCTVLFGAMSILTARADSITVLMICRFLTGWGLGGALPNVLALTNEYVPERIRRVMTTLMWSGFSLGAALAGISVAGLISNFGWQIVFLIGGAIPLLFALAFVLWLPESMRYLAVTKQRPDLLARYAKRIGIADEFTLAESAPASEEAEPKGKGSLVRQLFTEGRAPMTLLLWVILFANLLALNLLANWLPTLLKDAGLVIEHAALVTSVYQVGGFVGTIALGWALDRFKPFRVLIFNYIIAFLCIVGVGLSGVQMSLLYSMAFIAGFTVIGGICGSGVLVADSYPTWIRATGLGWALGIGRVGAIVGPLIGGIAISQHVSLSSFYSVGALPMLLAAIASWLIHGRRSGGAGTDSRKYSFEPR